VISNKTLEESQTIVKDTTLFIIDFTVFIVYLKIL
jgi:hypothetical protein